MTVYSKGRLQQIWDRILLSSWDEKGFNQMKLVVFEFIKETNPKIVSSGFEGYEDYLIELDLKRCLDVDKRYDVKVFKCWKTDVIGFIHKEVKKCLLILLTE